MGAPVTSSRHVFSKIFENMRGNQHFHYDSEVLLTFCTLGSMSSLSVILFQNFWRYPGFNKFIFLQNKKFFSAPGYFCQTPLLKFSIILRGRERGIHLEKSEVEGPQPGCDGG